MLRGLTYTFVALLVIGIAGFLLLGSRFSSYVRTAATMSRESVQETVPLEFELRRARTVIDSILPRLQSQVKSIAQEEVAIAALENDITRSEARLRDEHKSLASLREKMRTTQVSYSLAHRELSRQQLADQLHQRLERYKQGELALQSKSELLEKRREGLAASLAMLDKMRHRKAELEQQVEALAAQNRLLQATQMDEGIVIDGNQLSEAKELLNEIQTRLAVAQRVLVHQSDDVAIELDDPEVREENVLAAYDDYFDDKAGSETLASVEVSAK